MTIMAEQPNTSTVPVSGDNPRDIGRARMLCRLVRRHRWLFLADVLVSIVFYLFALAPGLAIREFFLVLGSPAPTSIAMLTALGAYVAFKIASAATGSLRMTTDTVFRFKIYTRLRTVLVTRLLSRPGALPLPCPAGDALSRLRDDTIEFAEVLGKRGLLNFAPALVSAMAAFVVMLSINVRVTLLAVLPTLGVFVVTFLTSRRVRLLRTQNRKAAGDVAALIREVFAGVEALKLARAGSRLSAQVTLANQVRQHAAVRDGAFAGLLNATQGSVVVVGTALIMIVAATAMNSGEFRVGDLALFVYNLTILGTCVLTGGNFISQYQRLDVSRQRLVTLTPGRRDADTLEPPAEPTERTASATTNPRHLRRPLTDAEPLRTLTATAVDWDHPNQTPALRDITLTFHCGQVVVIAGRIGSGKTTLVRGLLGLLPHTSGEIRWNNHPLLPGTALQPPYAAYTPQTPRIFGDTLRENVLLGQTDDARLTTALHTAALETDITRLPDGVNTIVGPRGHRLSGGQLHRLAAARMLACNADLLAIDDLSAALDTATEHQLWQRLLENYSDRAILVVSNRRAVIRRANRVVVMAEGRIAHQGTLDYVLNTSTDLREIWHRFT